MRAVGLCTFLKGVFLKVDDVREGRTGATPRLVGSGCVGVVRASARSAGRPVGRAAAFSWRGPTRRCSTGGRAPCRAIGLPYEARYLALIWT